MWQNEVVEQITFLTMDDHILNVSLCKWNFLIEEY